jgi:hypothetical protein
MTPPKNTHMTAHTGGIRIENLRKVYGKATRPWRP